MNNEELNLIHRCKEGDRLAQKELFDKLSAKMFALCIRYMGNRMAAEDILQEGFVTLFAKLDTYSGEGSFEGWSRRIFVNTALMSLRKNDLLKDSENIDNAWDVKSDNPTPAQNIGYSELMTLITSLPSGYRTIFNMYVVEGYSHKEIAQMLGITENTSRSQLQRARVILQKMIKDLY